MKHILYFLLASPCFSQPAIVFKRADGGVSIYRLKQDRGTGINFLGFKVSSDESVPEWIERHRVRIQKGVVDTVGPVDSYHVIPVADIPTDRTFRDAWVHNGSLAVDRAKAEVIHRERLRAASRKKAHRGEITFAESDTEIAAINALELDERAAPTLDDLKARKP